jgi:hypothetical protein
LPSRILKLTYFLPATSTLPVTVKRVFGLEDSSIKAHCSFATIDDKEEGAVISGSSNKLPVNWPENPEEIA